MKFVMEETGEKPAQTPFRPPGNSHGVNEARTRDPAVKGERLIACATEQPVFCVGY